LRTVVQAVIICVLCLICGAVSPGQDSAKPVAVTLCDLYQHPDRYQGRVVKVRAGSVSSLDIGDVLHDAPARACPSYMRMLVIFPDQTHSGPTLQLVKDEAYRKLSEALRYPGPVHIDATYEGRFDAAYSWRENKRVRVAGGAEGGYGKRQEYDGRIVLHQVSDVWSEPLPLK